MTSAPETGTAPADHDTGTGSAAAGTPVSVPWSTLPDYQCFGCSPHNPTGLRLEFHTHPEGIQTTFRAGRALESYPGVVHGGVVSTVCDETMGNLLVLADGRSAFTVALRMRYVSPLAVGVEYRCVARLRANQPDPDLIQAAAEILAPDGTTMATASATYQPVSMERARRHLVLSDDDAALLEQAMNRSVTAPTVS